RAASRARGRARTSRRALRARRRRVPAAADTLGAKTRSDWRPTRRRKEAMQRAAKPCDRVETLIGRSARCSLRTTSRKHGRHGRRSRNSGRLRRRICWSCGADGDGGETTETYALRISPRVRAAAPRPAIYKALATWQPASGVRRNRLADPALAP